MTEYDSEKIRYVDGKLKGIQYTATQVLRLWERLEQLNDSLSGGLSSPRIKSTEEAKYQLSPPVYHNRIPDLMFQEEETLSQFRKHEKDLIEIGNYLKRLDPEDVELLIYRYEFGLPIRTIARMYYTSKSSMWEKFNSILSKW